MRPQQRCGGNTAYRRCSDENGGGIETWLLDEVRPEDAARVGAFFDAFQRKGLYTPGAKPPQIEYRAQREPDRVCVRNGVFLKIDDAVSLYCCRTKKEEALTDGVAAFEVTSDEMVIPLYISEKTSVNFLAIHEKHGCV